MSIGAFILGEKPVVPLMDTVERASIKVARVRLRRMTVFKWVLMLTDLSLWLGGIIWNLSLRAGRHCDMHEGGRWRLVNHTAWLMRRVIFHSSHRWIHSLSLCLKVHCTYLATLPWVKYWTSRNMLLLISSWWKQLSSLSVLKFANKLLYKVISLLNQLLVCHIEFVLFEQVFSMEPSSGKLTHLSLQSR